MNAADGPIALFAKHDSYISSLQREIFQALRAAMFRYLRWIMSYNNNSGNNINNYSNNNNFSIYNCFPFLQQVYCSGTEYILS